MFDSGDFFLTVDLSNEDSIPVNAELLSPVIMAKTSMSGDYCLKFWTFMENEEKSWLDVILHTRPVPQEIKLAEFLADTDGVWNLKHVDINTVVAFQVTKEIFPHVLRKIFFQFNRTII